MFEKLQYFYNKHKKPVRLFGVLSILACALVANNNCSRSFSLLNIGSSGEFNFGSNTDVVGFWDPQMQIGTWRTDYNNINTGTASAPLHLLNCAYPFPADPYVLNGAGPTHWNDVIGQQVNCDQNSTTYPLANSATNAANWPTEKFWVITANSERAFGPEGSCSDAGPNTGPPNQSQKAAKPGQAFFGVESGGGKTVLSLDSIKFPACVSPVDKGKAHFLSFGAQMNRGNGDLPITYLNDSNYPDTLNFQVKLENLAPGGNFSSLNKNRHNYAYLLVEAMWGGVRRWVFVNFLTRTPDPVTIALIHWNWNIQESMWYPGSELINSSGPALKVSCPSARILAPILPPMAGAVENYSINLTDLYRCINTLPAAKTWTQPLPNQAVAITGIHWAIEQVFGPNETRISVQNLSLTDSNSVPVNSCDSSWEQMGTFYCQGGAEFQRICGCHPPLHNDPAYWVNEGNNCFSHATGKACAQARCHLGVTGSGTNQVLKETTVNVGGNYGYTWNYTRPNGEPISLPVGSTAYWMGSKNSVPDVVAGQDPQNLFNSGNAIFGTGNIFSNPGGAAISGAYSRYLVVKDPSGNLWCQSNDVKLTLKAQ